MSFGAEDILAAAVVKRVAKITELKAFNWLK